MNNQNNQNFLPQNPFYQNELQAEDEYIQNGMNGQGNQNYYLQTYDNLNQDYNGMYQNQEYQGGTHNPIYQIHDHQNFRQMRNLVDHVSGQEQPLQSQNHMYQNYQNDFHGPNINQSLMKSQQQEFQMQQQQNQNYYNQNIEQPLYDPPFVGQTMYQQQQYFNPYIQENQQQEFSNQQNQTHQNYYQDSNTIYNNQNQFETTEQFQEIPEQESSNRNYEDDDKQLLEKIDQQAQIEIELYKDAQNIAQNLLTLEKQKHTVESFIEQTQALITKNLSFTPQFQSQNNQTNVEDVKSAPENENILDNLNRFEENNNHKQNEVCKLCEKVINNLQIQKMKCCNQDCQKVFHKECVYQYMSVKQIFKYQTGENDVVYQFYCENCLLGHASCSICNQQSIQGSLIKTSSNYKKCSVKKCMNFAHKSCALKQKMKKFICDSHQCNSCKQFYKLGDKIARCVRCTQSCHQFKIKKTAQNQFVDIDAFQNQCFELSKVVPLKDNLFICQSHLNEEFKVIGDLNSNENLQRIHLIMSYFNQQKNAQGIHNRNSDQFIYDFKNRKNCDLINGSLRILGYSKDDIYYREKMHKNKILELDNPETLTQSKYEKVYIESRKNLNNFINSQQGIQILQKSTQNQIQLQNQQQMQNQSLIPQKTSVLQSLQLETEKDFIKSSLFQQQQNQIIQKNLKDFHNLFKKQENFQDMNLKNTFIFPQNCLKRTQYYFRDRHFQDYLNRNQQNKIIHPLMLGPVHAKVNLDKKQKMRDWNRLDQSEVITNSNKALDYIDDLVEQKMREQIEQKLSEHVQSNDPNAKQIISDFINGSTLEQCQTKLQDIASNQLDSESRLTADSYENHFQTKSSFLRNIFKKKAKIND